MGNVVATIINWPKLPKRIGKTFHERKAERIENDNIWVPCSESRWCPIPNAKAGEYEIQWTNTILEDPRFNPEEWPKVIDAINLYGWGINILAYRLKKKAVA